MDLDETVVLEGLRPDERVCGRCHLTHYFRLTECPTCKEDHRASSYAA